MLASCFTFFKHRNIVYIEFRFCPHLLANCENAPLEQSQDESVTPTDVLETVLKVWINKRIDTICSHISENLPTRAKSEPITL